MKQKNWIKSQSMQVALFVIIVSLLIPSFARFEDTIKLIGYPFQIIPNALGLTQSVSKNETMEYKIFADTTIDVPIKQSGYYYIFRGFYQWANGPDIEIRSPQGNAVNMEHWRNVSRFYDTIHVRGFPAYRFFAEEPGVYKFRLTPVTFTSLTKKFDMSIVPDYITESENIYRIAYAIQVIILVVIGAITYYSKIGKASMQRRKSKNNLGDLKRNQMDDFIKKNYRK